MVKEFHKLLSYLFISALHIPFVAGTFRNSELPAHAPSVASTAPAAPRCLVSVKDLKVYDSLRLYKLGLSRQAYEYAISGFNYLRSAGKLRNDRIISIVDFSLHSAKKRLFILDIKNYKILFNTYVAHGRNSGKDFASEFSNQNMSYKSSLGFYITRETYEGAHGYSLRLQGEETGINDNAGNRAIVMHSAWYVNENIIRNLGYAGRSEGCPAIPENVNKPIIEKIKNGSCLFLYSPSKYYISHSEILRKAQAA